ncbi:bifunctional diaminohydroxyphosphoribosylaminopyrimidine deaminase/5-amino-6-(5-phosphoribosylamino)uracil reductase RibD [Amphibacillus jilinensis]|uniref:bifunctional diaminohydroxyphosphoribosylaminopyrimidine deaminase/5-amino-6-(5-phosphoribosylamino)uracil reductase RibD n=1 Tax=Amphibacillus jilinensis TaxID=1216008 RepID=UPI0002F9B5AF|nr:bifunctional diaminohydroxyphosphoribosylaminopyrimidine deaminase/5-amino-6-(5-phosphoribosylamino)uracil reductase RibD [Amphibacillus jilinensis]
MNKHDYMALAISLAESTIGQTSPNPSVGAVVVKAGRIVGIGSHLKAGEGHAEVLALQQAGDHAEGADVYVTLEPCAHYGQTPPCAKLLIEKKVKRVYIATVDPNPKVAGQGIAMLKDAGIEVELGIDEQRARQINERFFYYIKNKRPFVTLKAAVTLDGKIATNTGDSQWITSEQAREDVHNERAKHDAILVGSQTIKADNPHLTVRQPQNGKNPIRIILSTDLSIPADRHILNEQAPTWVVCGHDADVEGFKAKYPHVKVIDMAQATIEICHLLQVLGSLGIQSLYVEGGSAVHASFIKAKAFQVCHWYVAPKLLGGQDAVNVVGGYSPEQMADAIPLQFESVTQIGQDIKMIARLKKEA